MLKCRRRKEARALFGQKSTSKPTLLRGGGGTTFKVTKKKPWKKSPIREATMITFAFMLRFFLKNVFFERYLKTEMVDIGTRLGLIMHFF